MTHQQTQVVPQLQSKTPVAPAALAKPTPIDLSLLSQISGGTVCSAPSTTW